MGARHQAFVIAKVGKGNQRRYRCVAAIHWQCLFGEKIVRATTRFINSVKNEVNGRLIQADLEAFDGYEARRRHKAVPCPYISMLYRMSTCIGADDGYSGEVLLLSADMASDGGDNGEGISIIDVTDPASPRYCMMSLDGLGSAEEDRVARYQPLSAKEYVQCYYPPSSVRGYYPGILAAHKGLRSCSLIDMATLAETWPKVYGKFRRQNRWDVEDYDSDEDDSDTDTDMADGATDDDDSDPDADMVDDDDDSIDEDSGDEAKSVKILPLVTMTISKAVHAILQNEDNADLIDFLLRVIIDQESIDAATASLIAESQLPDYILPVLAKVLMPLPVDGYMDLSQFALSGNQISQVAKLIPTCKTLKLGGRMHADVDDIINATKNLPDLDTVMLFDDLISVDQLAVLRRKLPSDRIRIAHRKEYFEYAEEDGPQYTRHDVPEFVFIIEATKRWSYGPPTIRGVGVEVLDDPNFILQIVRDFLRVEYDFDAASIGFTMKKREYGVPLSSSAFVSIASAEARMDRENPDRVQWGFVGTSDNYPLALKYGFFRYQHGSPLQIMDVDGFVTALSKERPDLPLVVSGPARPRSRSQFQFTSFLDEVRYLLGAKPGHNTELLPVKQAEEIIFGL